MFKQVVIILLTVSSVNTDFEGFPTKTSFNGRVRVRVTLWNSIYFGCMCIYDTIVNNNSGSNHFCSCIAIAINVEFYGR